MNKILKIIGILIGGWIGICILALFIGVVWAVLHNTIMPFLPTPQQIFK